MCSGGCLQYDKKNVGPKQPHMFGIIYNDSCTLQWRHYERDGVLNHQLRDCLLNRLFRRRSKKTLKIRVPAQRASDAENISIWWRHHVYWGVWHRWNRTHYITRTTTKGYTNTFMLPLNTRDEIWTTASIFLWNSPNKHTSTHWYRMTHICVSKLTIIGSDNGLSPGRGQAVIWTCAGIL